MKILPDDLTPPTATPEEQMEALGRRLFAADPAKVRDRLAAEAAKREAASEGETKRGRPRKAAP